MKKLHWLCNDGSALNVTHKSIFGEDGRIGVGGAELAMLTLCEGFHNQGYDVTLYNNPHEGGASSYKQKTLDEFDPNEDRDILVVFRSPNHRIENAKGLKVWMSCDQFTVGDFREFSKKVDKIVTISPFHASYFKEMYGITDTITIDLPVRLNDYKSRFFEKVSKKCIYTSVPDRGAMPLRAAWVLIHREVPDAQLVLTSDWRLWGRDIEESLVVPFRLAYASLPNTSYIGAIRREELIKHQLEADLHLYPSTYPELFCIAVAESQVAGAFPVTSQSGAIKTTNEFGCQIEGIATDSKFVDEFVQKTVELLQDPCLRDRQVDMMEKAKKRFSLDGIIAKWNEAVFNF